MASYGDDGVELTELTLGPPGANARRARRARRSGRSSPSSSSMVQAYYVKVSMDGTPYLRKVDVAAYGDYLELVEALNDMFYCSSIGLMDGYGEWEHAVVYEDGDGDWMLVGDVPWEMFVSSCKRMRVMRACEARGLSSNA
ncbi:auxin-responsive protein IAA26 [Oryza brachyantha]|uniref:Auxin-responsive protein n=1 Tax=Oryza brachyantha TaxID=4533 RepID=J3MZG4_ORYBR|nr:auxin-responsive protein IAA26 [Oryza brachyantha]